MDLVLDLISRAYDSALGGLLSETSTLDVTYDAPSKSVWMAYKASSPPHFSLTVLNDITLVRDRLVQLFAAEPEGAARNVRYLVMASHKAGVFNLGGDLLMFAKAVKAADRERLRFYAHQCVELVHGLATGFSLPIVTVAVVSGRAFGGGMEAALAEDFMIASADAQLGVPEVAFNSFPGMGAVSMLSRRMGMAQAEQVISSGAIYSGRQMFDMGVVDVLSEGPDVHAFARDWLAAGGEARFARRMALARTRRMHFPVELSELVRVTDLWVDCCCEVTQSDVRHMERLASAQKRLTAS